MKKFSFILIVVIAVAMLSLPVAYADGNDIAESPNINVVIDGSAGTYSDIPLIIDGRTMLPLRELLTKLGVQNDDQHITWNGTERSVTILKDTTKIYLKVGSLTALINDKKVTLDAAPIIYAKNGRTYIPARFVAQALGKVVQWDGNTGSVLIKDENDFNSVKDILTKVGEAGKAAAKLKYNSNISLKAVVNGINSDSTISASTEFDRNQKVVHMNMTASMIVGKLDMEYYYTKNGVYLKNTASGTWQKLPVQQDLLDKAFESDGTDIGNSDLVCAGLVKVDGSNPNEIVLKGNVYSDELMNSLNSYSGSDLSNAKINIKKFYIELTIDKNTNLVSKEYVECDMDVEMDGMKENIAEQATNTFDYSGNFELQLPDGVQ